MIDPALMDKPKRKPKDSVPPTPLAVPPVELDTVPQKWPLYAWRVRWQRLRRMLGKPRR